MRDREECVVISLSIRASAGPVNVDDFGFRTEVEGDVGGAPFSGANSQAIFFLA